MNLLYWYPKCSTCRKAKKYLDDHKIPYELFDLTKQTPSPSQLKKMLELNHQDIKAFFNTAGRVYQDLNLKDKLPSMHLDEKLALLSNHGMLIKRPLFVTKDKVILGFNEDSYKNIHSDPDTISLGESLEDYLETMLQLEQLGNIRSVDIAKNMGVSKPSVNKAIHVLKEKGFVTQKSYGDVYLTDIGRSFAENIFHRHLTLTKFLTDVLNLDEKTAEDDACKMEHVISKRTFHAIENLYRELNSKKEPNL